MGHLKICNVGKAYKRYANKWMRLAEWIIGRDRHEKHWVLRDISFEVTAGEAIGIIGVNGAGKSTLLKIITGTTQATTGTIDVGGHIAALLELGMGFHPDFTGRQNVYMGGQIHGLSTGQIGELVPEIEAFADIGDYIDLPLRTYSSGMQMRLAFAVATAIRPDILIVDEALSVGDAAFQRKCFRRIESFLELGTTLLFVSHDTETIKRLCNYALFIREGVVGCYDVAKVACNEYEKYLFGKGKQEGGKTSAPSFSAHFDSALTATCEQVYGDGRAAIESCWVTDLVGRKINVIESGQSFRWCYRVQFHDGVSDPIFAMMLKTREGITLYGTDTDKLNTPIRNYYCGDKVDITFELKNDLAPGVYYLNCGVRAHSEDSDIFLARRVDSAIIRVTSQNKTTVIAGVLDMTARVAFI